MHLQSQHFVINNAIIVNLNKQYNPKMSSSPITLPFTPAHRKVVMSLYRQSLKLAGDWINKRDHFRTKALEIRSQFDLHKDIGDPKEAQKFIKKAEHLLKAYKHPDPYIPPTRPDGTKFERYIAPSLDEPIDQRY